MEKMVMLDRVCPLRLIASAMNEDIKPECITENCAWWEKTLQLVQFTK